MYFECVGKVLVVYRSVIRYRPSIFFRSTTLIPVYREIVQAAPVTEAMQFIHGLYFQQA
jgi:hypothetical protein